MFPLLSFDLFAGVGPAVEGGPTGVAILNF